MVKNRNPTSNLLANRFLQPLRIFDRHETRSNKNAQKARKGLGSLVAR